MAHLSFNPLLQAYHHARHSGKLQASPPSVLAGSFIVLIVIGTLLLSLPLAQRQPFGIFEAFFTATSSVTVTGLTIIDPSQDLTFFGLAVMLALVQIGGIGFVTFAIIAAITLGKRVSLKYQAIAFEAFNQTSVQRIQQIAFAVFKFTLVIEISAILVLTLWWWRHDNLTHAFLAAGFHVVSAFNNAGLTLFPDSLARFHGDPVTTFVITFCVILGGLGFSILLDIYNKRAWSTLTYYSRIIILGTILLNLTSFAIFWLIELNNPLTIGHLPIAQQGLASWTQVVSARTAGFASVDINYLRDSSRFLLTGLMFIGGGSLSTASGIKLGTFIIIMAVVRSYVVQRKEVVLMGRTISPESVYKAFALLMIAAGLVWLGIFSMSLLEDMPFIEIVMEVMSAFSTTGLSPNLTHTLSKASQILLLVLMFVGRLGPLTLVYNLGTQGHSRVKHPETQIQVG